MVSNIFYFHPYLGNIPILTNIFQMGWNHQPEYTSPFQSGFAPQKPQLPATTKLIRSQAAWRMWPRSPGVVWSGVLRIQGSDPGEKKIAQPKKNIIWNVGFTHPQLGLRNLILWFDLFLDDFYSKANWNQEFARLQTQEAASGCNFSWFHS